MTLTIHDLAPLEDILVEEITENEQGSCEIDDHMGFACTVIPVGIIDGECDPDPTLGCKAGVGVVAKAIADPLADCIDCGRPCGECWSVVMLP